MDDGLLRSAFALQQAGNLSEAARLHGERARAAAGLLACEPTHPLFDGKRFTRGLRAETFTVEAELSGLRP